MTDDIRDMTALMLRNNVTDAPTVTRRHGRHVSATIAIGKDHTAELTMDEDAFNELCRLLKQ